MKVQLRYQQLKAHPNVLRSLTGLRPAEFEQLVQDVAPMFMASEQKRLLRSKPLDQRKRAIGGGHPFSLPMREQILLTVVWLRQYPTYEVMGFLFGVTHCTVSRLLTRTLPLLAQAGKDTMRMPDPGRKHRRSFSQLLSDLPELAVVIDTFEQEVRPPQTRDAPTPQERKRKQKEADSWYSGKKKKHTIKSQVGVDLHTGAICDVSESVRGPTGDMKLLRRSKLMQRLPDGVGGEGDKAYIGIDKLHPQRLGATPRRKPRGADKHRPRGEDKESSPEDIAYNKAFSARRIMVEHTLRYMRAYQSITHMDRHHRQMHTERVNAIAGLVNRRLHSRLPYRFI
jgi:DDE superfamily endonuclease/Helix-turn-helix of DDE superfamily endonuclease